MFLCQPTPARGADTIGMCALQHRRPAKYSKMNALSTKAEASPAGREAPPAARRCAGSRSTRTSGAGQRLDNFLITALQGRAEEPSLPADPKRPGAGQRQALPAGRPAERRGPGAGAAGRHRAAGSAGRGRRARADRGGRLRSARRAARTFHGSLRGRGDPGDRQAGGGRGPRRQRGRPRSDRAAACGAPAGEVPRTRASARPRDVRGPAVRQEARGAARASHAAQGAAGRQALPGDRRRSLAAAHQDGATTAAALSHRGGRAAGAGAGGRAGCADPCDRPRAVRTAGGGRVHAGRGEDRNRPYAPDPGASRACRIPDRRRREVRRFRT